MQVTDDLELLELMLEDTKAAPDIYKPTNLWTNYEKMFLPDIKKSGLHDFRRRRESLSPKNGAADWIYPLAQVDVFSSRVQNNSFTRPIPLWSNFLSFQNRLRNRMLPVVNRSQYGMRIDRLQELAY